MLFLTTKVYIVTTPLATMGLVVMRNMQICDSLPWTRMSLQKKKKKWLFKESFLTTYVFNAVSLVVHAVEQICSFPRSDKCPFWILFWITFIQREIIDHPMAQ